MSQIFTKYNFFLLYIYTTVNTAIYLKISYVSIWKYFYAKYEKPNVILIQYQYITL